MPYAYVLAEYHGSEPNKVLVTLERDSIEELFLLGWPEYNTRILRRALEIDDETLATTPVQVSRHQHGPTLHVVRPYAPVQDRDPRRHQDRKPTLVWPYSPGRSPAPVED